MLGWVNSPELLEASPGSRFLAGCSHPPASRL